MLIVSDARTRGSSGREREVSQPSRQTRTPSARVARKR
jgi:hypothetical protein